MKCKIPPCLASLDGKRLLAEVPSGQTVKISCVETGRQILARLNSMGLVCGMEICVINNPGAGPLLLGVGQSRISLGRGLAHKVIVDNGQTCADCDKNYR